MNIKIIKEKINQDIKENIKFELEDDIEINISYIIDIHEIIFNSLNSKAGN